MKNAKLTFIFLLITQTSFIAFAQSGEKKGVFDAASVDEFSLALHSGINIEIEGAETDQIEYIYSFKGNAKAYKRYFEDFDPQYKQEDGFAYFSLSHQETKKRYNDYQIDENTLKLKVPSNIKLQLTTEYSTTKVRNIGREVDIYNRGGSVWIENIGQSVKISNEFGDTQVRNVLSDVSIEGRSSEIAAKNIVGKVQISSNYSSISIAKIDGDVNIQNQSGKIEAIEIKGNFIAKGDYSEFELADVTGNTSIQTKSGTVKVDNIRRFEFKGAYTSVLASNIEHSSAVFISGRSANITLLNSSAKTTIRGDYLNIELNNVSGETVDIQSHSGTVNAQNIDAQFNFRGEYSKLNLDNFRGKELYIESRSEDAVIHSTSKHLSTHIAVEYGNLTLALPAKFEGRLDVSLNQAEISNAFKLLDEKKSQRMDKMHVGGFIGSENTGSDAGNINIRARNGKVRLIANQ